MLTVSQQHVQDPRIDAQVGARGYHVTRWRSVRAADLPRTTTRMQVTAAFQAMAGGLDAKTAYAKTKAFYCSSGGEWTRGLN